SPTQQKKCIRRRYGNSASEYLKQWKISRAVELMPQTTLSSSSIAYRCGLGTRCMFFRAYRRIKGKTPAAFRARSRKPSAPPFSLGGRRGSEVRGQAEAFELVRELAIEGRDGFVSVRRGEGDDRSVREAG